MPKATYCTSMITLPEISAHERDNNALLSKRLWLFDCHIIPTILILNSWLMLVVLCNKVQDEQISAEKQWFLRCVRSLSDSHWNNPVWSNPMALLKRQRVPCSELTQDNRQRFICALGPELVSLLLWPLPQKAVQTKQCEQRQDNVTEESCCLSDSVVYPFVIRLFQSWGFSGI